MLLAIVMPAIKENYDEPAFVEKWRYLRDLSCKSAIVSAHLCDLCAMAVKEPLKTNNAEGAEKPEIRQRDEVRH